MAVSSSRAASGAVGRWTAMVLMLSVMAPSPGESPSRRNSSAAAAGALILPAAKPAHKSALRRLAGGKSGAGRRERAEAPSLPIIHQTVALEEYVSFLAGNAMREARA